MSRRRQASRRPQSKDAKFNSTLVSRLVNTVMGQGKKSVAQRIVYGAFDEIATKNPTTNPLDVLQRAVDNAKTRLAQVIAQGATNARLGPRQQVVANTTMVVRDPQAPLIAKVKELAPQYEGSDAKVGNCEKAG